MSKIDFVFDVLDKRVFASGEFNTELLGEKNIYTPDDFVRIFNVKIKRITVTDGKMLGHKDHLNSHTQDLIWFITACVNSLCVTNNVLREKAVEENRVTIDGLSILPSKLDKIN